MTHNARHSAESCSGRFSKDDRTSLGILFRRIPAECSSPPDTKRVASTGFKTKALHAEIGSALASVLASTPRNKEFHGGQINTTK